MGSVRRRLSSHGPWVVCSCAPRARARRVRRRSPCTDAQWRAVGREAATLLSQYVAINTTNPPGNELQTAHWLKAVLAREGIEAQVFEPQAGKANLYARLKGDGSARPLILLNHMDGVLATPEYR